MNNLPYVQKENNQLFNFVCYFAIGLKVSTKFTRNKTKNLIDAITFYNGLTLIGRGFWMLLEYGGGAESAHSF